jgi:hypothetical protein
MAGIQLTSGPLKVAGNLGAATPKVVGTIAGSASTGSSNGAANSLQPAYNPNLNQSGTLAAAPKPAPVDPWAGTPWGSQAAYSKAVADYGSAKNTTYGSINDAENTAGNKYNSSILDFLDSFKAGQTNIDRSAVQNELTRSEGRNNVLDMVGSGLRSGGVILNNANASNSSAGEQLGRAYGEIGRKELSKVGNAYELGNDNIANQQSDLLSGLSTFQRHSDETKTDTVNSLVSSATSQLAQLNALAQNASLPDRIQIEQEKARIRNETMAKLSAYDSALASGVANTKASTADENRKKAQSLLQAGVAPENSFNLTTSVPGSLQGTGPFASNLPLFSGA